MADSSRCRYLVLVTCTAKPDNPSFKGTHSYYSGKQGHTCGDTEKCFGSYFVREYGYTRKCDAQRNWDYTHPEDEQYWYKHVTIVKFEI